MTSASEGPARGQRRRALGVVRALYCAALLGALAVVQVHAETRQFRSGYRPFGHAPSRVPYSWDMFAIRIDRCVIRWDPPLQIEGQPVAAWHDRAYPLEFDTIYDQTRSYETAAAAACRFRTSPRTKASLICATAAGRIDSDDIDCR